MQEVILIAFILILSATSIDSKDDFGDIKTNEEELNQKCKKMTTEFWKYFSGGFSDRFQNTTRIDLLEEVGKLCNDKDGGIEFKYPTLCNGLSDKLIHLTSNLCARESILKSNDNIEGNCNEMATEFWKYLITSDLAKELTLIYENCEEYAILCYGLDENFISLSSGLCGDLSGKTVLH